MKETDYIYPSPFSCRGLDTVEGESSAFRNDMIKLLEYFFGKLRSCSVKLMLRNLSGKNVYELSIFSSPSYFRSPNCELQGFWVQFQKAKEDPGSSVVIIAGSTIFLVPID